MKTFLKIALCLFVLFVIGTCYVCRSAQTALEEIKETSGINAMDAEREAERERYARHEVDAVVTLEPYSSKKVPLFKSPTHWAAYRDGAVLQATGDSSGAFEKFARADFFTVEGGITARVLSGAPHCKELSRVKGNVWITKIKILDGEHKGQVYWVRNQDAKR